MTTFAEHYAHMVVLVDQPDVARWVRLEAPNATVVVLPRDAGRTDIAGALRGAVAPERGEITPISPRETDILRGVARGQTNAEIGDAIGLARNTVKAYLQSAMRKLGARNRVEAIARAREFGIL
jgi:DNA-binding CsgD family transcriptional regulator